MEILNVRFKESVYMGGHSAPTNNYMNGMWNGTVKLDKGFVEIEIPENGDKKRLLIHVPLSNIRQIEFKA